MTTTKAYDKDSSALFDADRFPVHKNWKVVKSDELSKHRKELRDSLIPKSVFGFRVVSYELKLIPEEYKKNKMDNAKLLVMTTGAGNKMAKRHNNNQSLKF